ncbi:hypothetical protein HG531_010335 [Fusarium graminearum]|nr:hypothetical protein HG531_010335 [Fusarium graminearum]
MVAYSWRPPQLAAPAAPFVGSGSRQVDRGVAYHPGGYQSGTESVLGWHGVVGDAVQEFLEVQGLAAWTLTAYFEVSAEWPRDGRVHGLEEVGADDQRSREEAAGRRDLRHEAEEYCGQRAGREAVRVRGISHNQIAQAVVGRVAVDKVGQSSMIGSQWAHIGQLEEVPELVWRNLGSLTKEIKVVASIARNCWATVSKGIVIESVAGLFELITKTIIRLLKV